MNSPNQQQDSSATSDTTRHPVDDSSASRIPCPSCQDTFTRAEHLARHVRKHTGERPYSCSVCGKQFARSDSMKRHELLHSTSVKRRKASNISNDYGRTSAAAISPSVSMNQDDAGWASVADGGLFAAQDQAFENQAQAMAQLNANLVSDYNWLPVLEYREALANPFGALWDNSSFATLSSRNEHQQQQQPVEHGLQRIDTRQNAISPVPVTSPVATSSMVSGSLEDSSRLGDQDDAHGETYVEGRVTRLPKGKKRKMSFRDSLSQSGPAHLTTEFSFAQTRERQGSSPENSKLLPQDAYVEMLSAFSRTCTVQQSVFHPFEEDYFPSQQVMNFFIQHAVDYFLPGLPLVYKGVLGMAESSWHLYLALAAVGTRYVSGIDEQEVESFDEFLKRTLLLLSDHVGPPKLETVQAKILACVAFSYGGSRQCTNSGRMLIGELAEIATSTWYDSEELGVTLSALQRWIARQSRIRAVNSIWLLDRLMAYQLSHKALLQLEDATFPLPSSDVLWNSSIVDDEFTVIPSTPEVPSLKDAIEALYIRKQIDTNVGELGRVILVQAIICQTNVIADRYQSRLSLWEPCSANSSSQQSHLLTDDTWLPGIPVYARWRNAACDCLDVLHWHANSVIGLSAGREHPTVLFLHLSRVILLCPVDAIKRMVHLIIRSASSERNVIEKLSREIVKWAHDDCYKARLAIIHAGVLLYHVRRHSLNSFYEPSAIFAAVLCLWAYASAHSSIQTDTVSVGSLLIDADEEGLTPNLIHLDRPCDDELVQMFITKGNKIIPNVTGVGNICAPRGPDKILKLGVNVLRFARNWDLKNQYVSTLTQLQDRVQRSGRSR